MKRRTFLGLLGATTLGGVGGLEVLQPRERTLQPRDAGTAARLDRVRKVVVIGGGLAGLSAGIGLARRGFEVTLLERGNALGGKLTGWTVDALGESFPIEHGFHGFFGQYYNLNALLEEAGCTRDLAPSPGYPLLFADRPEERFGQTTKLFPFNLISVVNQSKSIHWSDFRHERDGLTALLRYDPARAEALDTISFAEFMRTHGINRPMVETVLAPFAKATLNRVENLSAAEALRFFHFYFMGNPEGLGFRYLTRNSMDAVIDPLRRLFESLGGTVRTAVTARRLVREGNAIASVEIEGVTASLRPSQLPRQELPPHGYLEARAEDGTPIFVARRQGRVVAFDGRCTHMGCPVLPEGEGFRCPCHGGRYDAEGAVLNGPPIHPLRRVPVTEHADGTLTLGASGATTAESLACDHCVVACEVRGTKQLIARSNLSEPVLASAVAALGEADPYVVFRLWLDKPVAAERLPFYSVSRYRYVDSLALYSRFQEPFVDWARRTGGSVVELHAYAIAPEDLVGPDELRARMLEELWRMLPELKGSAVLHQTYQQQSNFTRWAPGDLATRPGTRTGIPNLFLAGDWVKLDVAAFLMEGAVVSGKSAANAICEREGVRGAPIDAVPEKGPLAF
jgi:isorenieratene synthase